MSTFKTGFYAAAIVALVSCAVASAETMTHKEESSRRERPVAAKKAPRRRAAPVDFSRRRIAPEQGSVRIQGELRVHFLTKNVLCVIGDYNGFLKERFDRECGAFMKELASRRQTVADWSYNFHYSFAAHDVICAYRPQIAGAFQSGDHFELTSRGETVATEHAGYWLNAIGQMRLPDYATGEPKLIHNAGAVAHFAFLSVPGSLRNGQAYTVTTHWGEKVDFVYREAEGISWGLKVNQVGYAADAGSKYVYAGGWLGTGGELDLSFLEAGTFQVIDEASGKSVFAGETRLRMKDQPGSKARRFTGETVYEMDFSSFATPGRYHIYVPGMGRSWGFSVGNSAVGDCFYTHARGLYHKRCGIAKDAKHTPWVSGECHTTNTYRGGFAPEDSHYRTGDGHFGIFDENGTRIKFKHFTMIAETATEEPLGDVWGGWHDAADYDRRTFHFEVVRDLLTPFLLEPATFTDGQLNIPESGNGIPDIVDEAAWGVDVWRRAQNGDGGVGCWLEATSHPKDANPATDTQRYYLALPTRESTIDYAAQASLLANAYAVAGASDRSKLFLESAQKAYRYAMDPAHRVETTWTHKERDGKVRTLSYRESEQIPAARWIKAALNLYHLTGDPVYKQHLDGLKAECLTCIKNLHHKYSPYYFVELHLYDDVLPECSERYRKAVTSFADQVLGWQEKQAYRNAFFPPDHGFSAFMSWGNALPLRWSRFPALAWKISGDQRYRDAALLNLDWHNGTNPMGRSHTSGLGSVYPVRFLDLPSYTDGIDEFVPGITPYTYTFGVSWMAQRCVYGLYLEARKDHGFAGKDISILPGSESFDDTKAILQDVYPVWRRFGNIEGLAVAQNEYTVWETIGPAAGVTAMLMPSNWMPDKTMLERRPVKDVRALPGYIAQP